MPLLLPELHLPLPVLLLPRLSIMPLVAILAPLPMLFASSLPGHPANFSVASPVGLENNSAGGTNNLIHQIVSSDCTSHIPPPTTTSDNAPNEDFIQIDGTFYDCIYARTDQY
jgi:hypothetical protein